MPYIDWKKLKARVSIVDILGHYNVISDLTETPQGYEGTCPICGSNAFKANTEKNAWFCFGECKASAKETGTHNGGNILDLVATLEQVSIKDAAAMIADWFPDDTQPKKRTSKTKGAKEVKNGRTAAPHTGENARKRGVRRAEESEGTNASEQQAKEPAPPAQSEAEACGQTRTGNEGQGSDTSEPSDRARDRDEYLLGRKNTPLTFSLKSIDHEHLELDTLGLSRETLHAFDVGYFTGKGMMHNKIVIPFHGEDGRIVAYVGYDPNCRDFTHPDKQHFDPRLELFNFARAEHGGLYQDRVVLVTDLLNVLRLYELGVKRVVALLTERIHAPQVELVRRLVGYGGNVDFVPWSREYADNLKRLCEHFHVRLHRYYQGSEDEFLSQVVNSLSEW